MCDTCPEAWIYFQKKCYYFGEGAKKWIQARYACEDLDGRLVSIHSPEEQVGLGSAGEAADSHPDLLGVRAGESRHISPALQPCSPPQDFLTKRASWRGSWIGLRDLDIEGEFIWMDNQPLDYR